MYRDPGGRVDGIRDYSAVLADALAEQGGGTELALVASPRDVRAVPDARNIVIQYNPFAWGDRGVAPALSASVRALRRRRRRPTIALMVHEPFMPFSGVRATAMGVYQRVQLARLRRASDLAFVSTEPWVELVSRWGPGKPVHLLPVCSALPDRRDRRHAERARLQIGEDELVVATFGTDHPSRLTEYVHLAVGAILRGGHRVVLMNLGAGARSPTPARRNVRVIAPGELPLEVTAALLSTADLFLAPFVDGVSTRRSSVMAALQHGLPVVGTLGESTGELLGRSTDALALTRTARLDLFADAAVSLANEPDARMALGERGRELYERHFAPAVVGRILQAKLEAHRRGHSSR